MGFFDRARVMMNVENTLRITQLVLGVFVLSLTAGWNSKDVTYSDLNQGDYDEEGKIVYAIVIGFLSLIYLGSVLFYSYVSFPKSISPQLDICGNTILFILMFIGAILLGSTLTNLGSSLAVKEADLSLHALSAALVFTLALCILFGVGTLFAYWENRRGNILYGSNSKAMSELQDNINT